MIAPEDGLHPAPRPTPPTRHRARRVRRGAAVGALALGLLGVGVGSASADASTTSLTVTLPQDPFTSVSVRPAPGRPANAGHAIKPGQHQEFPISVGRLHQGGTLDFPAVQTYSDGAVVKWDQVAKQGQAEPDHPAPSFIVEAAPGAGTTTGPRDTVGDGLARGNGGTR